MSLTQRANYVFNALALGGSVAQYWGRYFASRRFDRDQDFYVVYTDIDHGIPFQPESSSE